MQTIIVSQVIAILLLLQVQQQHAIVKLGEYTVDHQRTEIYWQRLGPSPNIAIEEIQKNAPLRMDIRIVVKENGKYSPELVLRGIVFPIQSILLAWKRHSEIEAKFHILLLNDKSGNTRAIFKDGDTWVSHNVTGEFFGRVLKFYER